MTSFDQRKQMPIRLLEYIQPQNFRATTTTKRQGSLPTQAKNSIGSIKECKLQILQSLDSLDLIKESHNLSAKEQSLNNYQTPSYSRRRHGKQRCTPSSPCLRKGMQTPNFSMWQLTSIEIKIIFSASTKITLLMRVILRQEGVPLPFLIRNFIPSDKPNLNLVGFSFFVKTNSGPIPA